MAKKSTPQEQKDIQELKQRQAFLTDANRSTAVKKRHASGNRTARENIDDLCDASSFNEIGSLIVAGQKDVNQFKN